MTDAPAPLRLAFVILAHDRPEAAAELARTLTAAARDATAHIHYDARAPEAELARLRAAVAEAPRVRLVARRVACPWGSFGLVQAPLNALAEIEAEGPPPDYVTLLSGACLPCRPVAAYERFLAANLGRELIEVGDARWIGNGWRDERWRYRFWFNHKTQRPAEWLAFHAQRLLGLERRFPEGLTPRFGSQWWALSWGVCEAMLADIRRRPERLAFFRRVWIPDEMVFQTWVHALVPPEAIAGYGPTHFQFTNRGKPVVFHDDHADYVLGLDRFFFRKASPRAAALRAACLARAAAPDDGAGFERIGRRRADYAAKVAAQTAHPLPGQIFWRDQHADMIESVLDRAPGPYLVAVGPPPLTRALLDRLAARAPSLTALGEVFAPGEVDLGPGRAELGGLARADAAIRDAHPALFLVRLRARCEGVPALAWSPLRAGPTLAAVLADPRALKIACLPCGGDEAADELALGLACLAEPRYLPLPPVPMPGIAPERAARARIAAVSRPEGGGVEGLGAALIWGTRDAPGDATLRATALVLPWQPRPDPRAARQGLGLLEESLERCRFRRHPWFAEVAEPLRELGAELARGGLPRELAPAAAAFPDAFRPGAPAAEARERRPATAGGGA